MTPEIEAAAERLNLWYALPEGCPLQERYAIYPRAQPSGVGRALQEDVRLLAREYLRIMPLLGELWAAHDGYSMPEELGRKYSRYYMDVVPEIINRNFSPTPAPQ